MERKLLAINIICILGAALLTHVALSEALRNENNQIKRDANGVVLKGEIEHVDVMRRGKNFGEAYGENRPGEWEYAGYKLDGTYATTPDASVQCTACHRKASPENDFVFRMRAPALAGQM